MHRGVAPVTTTAADTAGMAAAAATACFASTPC